MRLYHFSLPDHMSSIGDIKMYFTNCAFYNFQVYDSKGIYNFLDRTNKWSIVRSETSGQRTGCGTSE